MCACFNLNLSIIIHTADYNQHKNISFLDLEVLKPSNYDMPNIKFNSCQFPGYTESVYEGTRYSILIYTLCMIM